MKISPVYPGLNKKLMAAAIAGALATTGTVVVHNTPVAVAQTQGIDNVSQYYEKYMTYEQLLAEKSQSGEEAFNQEPVKPLPGEKYGLWDIGQWGWAWCVDRNTPAYLDLMDTV